jgi:hypothetical protein
MEHEGECKSNADEAKVDVATEVLEQLVSEGKASRLVGPDGEVVYRVHWEAAIEEYRQSTTPKGLLCREELRFCASLPRDEEFLKM